MLEKSNSTVMMCEFEINTTPLEKISIDTNSIEIWLDDIAESRYKLTAKPYQAVRVTSIDCVSSLDYYNEFCFRDGSYHRHILHLAQSAFINELKEKTSNSAFLDKSKHFVLPLQDIIVEIISYELNLERI
jgi:hypothetical protein